MRIYHQSVFDPWPLEDKSVQLIATSPPYWGLRKYDIPDIIIGGRLECEHEWQEKEHKDKRGNGGSKLTGRNPYVEGEARLHYKEGSCIHCGAWKGQHGLEPDFRLYIEHVRLWALEARRVLRDDGVFFLNMGDSYGGSWGNHGSRDGGQRTKVSEHFSRKQTNDFVPPGQKSKAKCKLLIPHRVAIALIDDGWILRNDIVWSKPNGMPESVRDRFSKKFEMVFMFVKSSKTLCWYHDETKQWAWNKPNPDYIWVNNKTGIRTKTEPLNWRTASLEGKRKLWNRRNLWQDHDYYFDLDAVREPHNVASWGLNKDGKYDGKGKKDYKGAGVQNPSDIKRRMAENINPLGKNPGDVWTIPTQSSPHKHYAIWPEKLVKRMVLCASRPGDTVIDPFCGSGTSLKVTDELNREAVGIDLGYEDIQAERLTEIQRELL